MGSGRFPENDEFVADLSAEQAHQMRGQYETHPFERSKDYGTIKMRDVPSSWTTTVTYRPPTIA